MFLLHPIETAISDYKETCNLWEIHVEDYEFPNKWFDYRLFPFGWAPGTGTRYCVDIETGKIYNFNPDGGIGLSDYDSISHLLKESLKHHK